MSLLLRSFLTVLIALMLLVELETKGECHAKQELVQSNGSAEHAGTPGKTDVHVPKPENAATKADNHQYDGTPIRVSPVEVRKTCFDYVVSALTLLFAGALVVLAIKQWRTYEAQRKILDQQTTL